MCYITFFSHLSIDLYAPNDVSFVAPSSVISKILNNNAYHSQICTINIDLGKLYFYQTESSIGAQEIWSVPLILPKYLYVENK